MQLPGNTCMHARSHAMYAAYGTCLGGGGLGGGLGGGESGGGLQMGVSGRHHVMAHVCELMLLNYAELLWQKSDGAACLDGGGLGGGLGGGESGGGLQHNTQDEGASILHAWHVLLSANQSNCISRQRRELAWAVVGWEADWVAAGLAVGCTAQHESDKLPCSLGLGRYSRADPTAICSMSMPGRWRAGRWAWRWWIRRWAAQHDLGQA